MFDARHPHVGGERPIDEGRVRRLIRDATDEARIQAGDVLTEFDPAVAGAENGAVALVAADAVRPRRSSTR